MKNDKNQLTIAGELWSLFAVSAAYAMKASAFASLSVSPYLNFFPRKLSGALNLAFFYYDNLLTLAMSTYN